MFISMLLTYSYCLGARRRWWMPFPAPFLTACKRFAENTSSSRINLFKWLFYCFILNQAIEFLPNPFRRGCPCPIGCIQRYHAVGGQTAHHVDDVCGGGCVGDRRNSRTIPTVETYGAGVFRSRPNPYSRIPVNRERLGGALYKLIK
jgi:hypothetical protein